ncbi:hypothetical protein JJB09_14680 [Rhizobium sp. KVB221]|uniref:Polysaccharide chain length determinant N-terminal domain-containing protein n=1 Tax=Rhizobium setariae TaxID=2801340 RepID=A0A937CLK2_9HYPH|nr:polysaccharide biosynthesis tyrosine autokinase [Rhizobium setariae]MBL0373280.1 hypothetical protein [Rhizobium setariae]
MLTTERAVDAFTMRSQHSAGTPHAGRSLKTYGLSELFQLVWRYKRFLAAFVAAGTLLSIIITMLTPEVYTATSAIVFDRNDTRPYEAVVEAQKQERDKSAMETELDVIRSRVFVGIVVDAMKLVDDPYYNSYLPAADMENGNWLRSSIQAVWRVFRGKSAAGSEAPTTTRIISESAQRDKAISTLLSTFSVDRKGDSLAMSIRVDQANPVQAAAIANAVAQYYVSWTSGLKEAATKDTVKYLRKQAEDLAISITRREREIASFTATSDLTFDPKDDLLRARMEQLNEQFVLARVDEAGAWAKVNEAQQRLKALGQDGAGKVFTSELLTSLRTEEARLQRLRGQLTSKFGINHPLVVDADAELASNKAMIADEAGRILKELENSAEIATVRVKNFEHEVSLLQDRIKSRNLAEIKRRELERDLLSEQKRYDAVLLRLSTLDPDQEEVKATAMVSSFAEVPVQPSFPQPTFLIAAGILGSAILAVILMIVLDAIDDRIHRPEAASELLNRPNLVHLPDYRKGSVPVSDPYRQLLRDPGSSFANAMRSLCLAWRTIDSSAGGKIVMFVSSSQGDGKTTLSLSMATVAKLNGLRAAVIDLNPQPGGAADLCGVRTLPDGVLGRYLDGKGELRDVVATSSLHPFLDVIASRAAMQDYERLFAVLRDRYDLVVVDTPSIETADDAIWLSAQVDSIFIIVAAGKTHGQALTELAQRLNLNHALLIGSILNFYGKPKARRARFGPINSKEIFAGIKAPIERRLETFRRGKSKV